MDEGLAVAVQLVGGLSALDVAVCLSSILAELPVRRFPALNESTGEAFLDFAFANGDVASAYLSACCRELCPAERKEHMPAVARCITEADLELGKRPRGKARAVLRVYRNKSKVCKLLKVVRESKSRDVDFSFIRDAML
ncbi:hypothetical protein SePPVgORF054 [Seal parapoxvirus]|uniref:Uncharacterized protein n=1 Tax=Seal parapoxvirus TaxID=187984 RepID=A0A1Z3GCU3_9POXV|nr:hypothetical protein CGV03_gp054 [Seal parapoxvirus]ASC55577.1 hypothetical protein SePPVgORF054 [Seal parapoxvirus]